ncbi:MAG TPA: hypothetical protein VGM47_06680 [Gammaproteobacteria bacterium]
MDPAYDLHSISIISGRDRYNIATYSHINRSSKAYLQTGKSRWATIEKGQYRGWSWDFESEPSAFSDVSPFIEPTAQAQKLIDGKPVMLPSLTQMMQRLRDMTSAMVGADMPPLDLRLTFIPVSLNAKQYVEHHSDDSIVLDYYLPAPNPDDDPATRSIDWMSFDARLAAHEYLHALIETGHTPKLPNGFTEEVTAYTFETCAQLYTLGTSSGIRFVDSAGKTLDPKGSSGPDSPKGFMNSSAEVSDDGRIFAMYNIVHVLGKSVIAPGDEETRSMLYGLCRAMIHEPADLTREYYPAVSVQPLMP